MAFPLQLQPHIWQFLPPPISSTKQFLNPPQLQINTITIPIKKPRYLCVSREKENAISSIEKNSQFLWGIFTNMWWTKLRAAIGQRFNLEGIVSSSKVLTKDQVLLLPHLKVPDLRYINWEELRRRGFKGVVFDKDNTITLPYSLALWDPLKPSLENCKAVFGEENVAVFSNSVGLYEFDPDESKAEALEREMGIQVIRHKVKKPAGNAEEIEKQLGCRSMEVVMVGDRRFTDIVFGNRNGLLTVLTEPLTGEGENLVVKMVRKVEDVVVENGCKRGLKARDHCFLPNIDVNLVCLNKPL